ncbi:MAG TPA: DNA polymerase III subunit beta [Buchnera sp. (in: enterobacteria)]|nr:DNA polymerase III subunit beta [Buchnera sp. (in: enterobacteria)]
MKKKKIDFFISEKILKKSIKHTNFCMAHSDVRHYLNGTLFEIKNNYIKSTSTDGYRISIYKKNIKTEDLKESIIIPRLTINELFKILQDKSSLIKISIFEKKNICIKTNDLTFTSKLVDGEFPNCKNLFAKEKNRKKIIINKTKFQDALHRISILCNEQLNGISLFIDDKYIKITSQNQKDEFAEETIEIINQNNLKKINISINVNYILDVIKVIEGTSIQLIINQDLSNIQIKDCEDSSSKYLIMSLRI